MLWMFQTSKKDPKHPKKIRKHPKNILKTSQKDLKTSQMSIPAKPETLSRSETLDLSPAAITVGQQLQTVEHQYNKRHKPFAIL